jgi:arylsulfatase A-like enzyme
LNENWLPVWLQQLGYNTYYTGKLFNSHSVTNYNQPPVNGFNGSDFLLDPYTYSYWNTTMSRNTGKPVSYEGQYSPDVVAEKAYGFLDEASKHQQPFFLGVAPIAPHSEYTPLTSRVMNIPKYAPRHAHLFNDYKIPRTANFNPDNPSGVGWVKGLPKLNESEIEYYDEFGRARLRSLQAVDEMVEQIVQLLEERDLLDNTYIIYTSDNGYHIGQHRLPPGKTCSFETDIHIPLAVRGPGVPAGHVAEIVSSHTDLTPTILKLAGEDRPDLDGSPIPLTQAELAHPASGEHVNVAFWGSALAEGKYGRVEDDTALGPASRNNTYKALRIIGDHYSSLYTVWCNGEREFYNLHHDPDQVHNLVGDSPAALLANQSTLLDRPLHRVVDRLDALLMVTKSCKAHSCRKPWETLHPDGRVASLADALHPRYDPFYHAQPKVAFSSCQLGYIRSEEGPQDVHVWDSAAAVSLVEQPSVDL